MRVKTWQCNLETMLTRVRSLENNNEAVCNDMCVLVCIEYDHCLVFGIRASKTSLIAQYTCFNHYFLKLLFHNVCRACTNV